MTESDRQSICRALDDVVGELLQLSIRADELKTFANDLINTAAAIHSVAAKINDVEA